MRIILYTGKGGVGKTSVAAATACKLGAAGKKVLIMSTDQAHSLGDSFNKELGNTPEKISDNLYGMEIDTVLENEKAWGNLQNYLKELLTSKSGGSIETEELLVFPGFEELFSLFKMMEIYEEGEYDVLVIDCAPTGETLSLLKFPEMLGNWIEKILPIKRKALKVVGPVVEKTARIPMPQENIFDEVENLFGKMEKLQNLMLSKEILSIRIVTTPEKIVVKESKRNFTYLHLYDYNVDAVVINKIYPREALEGYFDQWIINQEESLKDIKNSFSGLQIFKMPLLTKELRTLERLEMAGNLIYEEKNPDAIFSKETIFKMNKVAEGYCFGIALPFMEKRDFELYQKGEELFLTINNQQRNIILPSKLKEKNIIKATYDQGELKIFFA
ncbi:MAG: ArsA family ATPase [Eubacteriaceae bacterium]